MKALVWTLAALGSLLLWLLWELLSALFGEAAWTATEPVRRPVWRAFVRARWPWPLLLVAGVGGVASVGGLWAFKHSAEGWRAGAGLTLFLGGAFVALTAPFVWRDARQVRARGAARSRGGPTSRPAA